MASFVVGCNRSRSPMALMVTHLANPFDSAMLSVMRQRQLSCPGSLNFSSNTASSSGAMPAIRISAAYSPCLSDGITSPATGRTTVDGLVSSSNKDMSSNSVEVSALFPLSDGRPRLQTIALPTTSHTKRYAYEYELEEAHQDGGKVTTVLRTKEAGEDNLPNTDKPIPNTANVFMAFKVRPSNDSTLVVPSNSQLAVLKNFDGKFLALRHRQDKLNQGVQLTDLVLSTVTGIIPQDTAATNTKSLFVIEKSNFFSEWGDAQYRLRPYESMKSSLAWDPNVKDSRVAVVDDSVSGFNRYFVFE